MNISVVIPNYNGRELLEKNLGFVLEAKKNKKNQILEIIVTDDASSDDSTNFLKDNYSQDVRVIEQDRNLGFSGNVNSGVKNAKGDLICLINTDVSVTNDFLEHMTDDFADKNVFAVSLHEKGFGYALGKFENGFIVHEPAAYARGFGELKETFWVSGGSGVFRKSIWCELGGLDDKVLSPYYWEDVDLSYRAYKRGYKILWDFRANVFHDHESTMKKLDQKRLVRIRERNYLLFNWKNITSKRLFLKHVEFLIKRIITHPGYLRIVLMALMRLDSVKNARAKEYKEAKVSDEAVFAKFN